MDTIPPLTTSNTKKGIMICRHDEHGTVTTVPTTTTNTATTVRTKMTKTARFYPLPPLPPQLQPPSSSSWSSSSSTAASTWTPTEYGVHIGDPRPIKDKAFQRTLIHKPVNFNS
ncbi:hypothetical protein BGX34_007930, partial [Mortierella sp. NVP85]